MSEATWNQFCGDFSWVTSQSYGQERATGQITWTGQNTSGWSRIGRELLAMEDLSDNWDNMGAVAPHPILIDSAASFLHRMQRDEHLAPPDMVMPGPEGTIIFAWHWAPGSTLEAEIGEPGVAELFSKEPGMDADSWLYEFDHVQPGDAVWEVSADAVTQAA